MNDTPMSDKPMKKTSINSKPLSTRQINKLKREIEKDPRAFEIAARRAVLECAEGTLPTAMVTTRGVDWYPDGCEDAGALGCPDEEADRFCERLSAIPVTEFTRAVPYKYSCAEFGSVTVVVHTSKLRLPVRDIVRISGVEEGLLRTYIDPDQFITLKLFGKGDVDFDLVAWRAASLFCVATDTGRLFITWLCREIGYHLPSGVTTEAISAGWLHSMVPVGAAFPEWKTAFLGAHQDAGIEACGDASADFAIPLPLARSYVISKPGYFSMLAYVFIREAESASVDLSACALVEQHLGTFHLYPILQEQIKARALHLFLNPKQPFDAWFDDANKACGLVNGLDYFTEPPPNDQSGPGCDTPASTRGDILLTVEAAVRIGEASPTARGELIRDYTRELGLTPPAVQGAPVATTGNRPG